VSVDAHAQGAIIEDKKESIMSTKAEIPIHCSGSNIYSKTAKAGVNLSLPHYCRIRTIHIRACRNKARHLTPSQVTSEGFISFEGSITPGPPPISHWIIMTSLPTATSHQDDTAEEVSTLKDEASSTTPKKDGRVGRLFRS
jgi:hypothetical protein